MSIILIYSPADVFACTLFFIALTFKGLGSYTSRNFRLISRIDSRGVVGRLYPGNVFQKYVFLTCVFGDK